MSVIGIVCEFNPFHNGHKYLIDSVKQHGDIVVCVMSGNFVQRAEPAIFPKDVRVKAALLNGADIVLELPFVYATASAEFFACNAVRILDAFGCDKLAFGTEYATIEQLNKIVDTLNNDNFNDKIKKYLQNGESYASARHLALKAYGNDFDIDMPNNILAVEYIKAIRKINSKIEPYFHSFSFSNYGEVPAVILQVNPSCKCTKVKYNKAPIPIGSTDSICVYFNSKESGKGYFDKAVKVRINSSKIYTLRIRGMVE